MIGEVMPRWKRSKTLQLLLVLAALSFGNAVLAADILHTRLEDGSGFIAVMGQLELGDEKKFNLIAQQYNKAAVLFSSPGGNLLAGIEIGKVIRMRNFGTGVAPGTMCASACALAWLGGTKRYIASESRVGFHAASIVRGGVARETGLGNAIVGAYLTQLGLPMAAVIYISHKPPDDMKWLSAADAREVGIDVETLELEQPPSAPLAPRLGNIPGNRTPNTNESGTPRANNQWLVVASRSVLSDAVELAEQYKRDFPETTVFLTANGQYAVSLGKFAMDESTLDGLKEKRRIPADSYFSKGTKFTSSAWP